MVQFVYISNKNYTSQLFQKDRTRHVGFSLTSLNVSGVKFNDIFMFSTYPRIMEIILSFRDHEKHSILILEYFLENIICLKK
jgi:hypothetical protein